MVDARTTMYQPICDNKARFIDFQTVTCLQLILEGSMNHEGKVSATLSTKNAILKGLGMRALLEPHKRPILGVVCFSIILRTLSTPLPGLSQRLRMCRCGGRCLHSRSCFFSF